ncbi:MAG: fibronectin type 3 domain-containing protein, partial [Oceanicoccus sp.]
LYRMWESDGWEELARLEPTVFQYEDVELKPYRKLSYKIVALDVDGLESDSHITNSIESPVAVNLQVTTNNLPRKVRLTWNKQQLIDSYNLYRTPVSNLLKWEKIKVLKSGLSDFTDNAGLADGTRYQYKLIPVDSNGEIAASNTATAVTKPLPNPPEEFNVESGLLKSIRISWMASKDTDVGGYQIYRSTDGADLKPYERVRGHENSFFVDKGGIFSNLKDEDTFTYSIASFNQFGAQGPASEPKEATTMSVPRIVSGFAANLSDGSVSLSWTLNTEENITQYMVFRSNTTDCKKLLEIASLAQVISSYIDDSSEVSTGLCYAIAAKNSSNLVSVMSEMIKI